MNIFYEESGQFKVANVIQKNDTTYQVNTQHGKRAKIKINHVFFEFEQDINTFLDIAQREANLIDTPLLWEVCGEEEITAENIAIEYFGATANKIQIAAILMALYAAPIYFYKKSRGIFKAASKEVLQQALAAIERKKLIETQIQTWVTALTSGQLPNEIATDLAQILHAPDKQSTTYKAFMQAADALKINAFELAKRVGGIQSMPDYLLQRFKMKYFPKGTGFHNIDLPIMPQLPQTHIRAFSIDDVDTTEIDDALSVQHLDNGNTRIGIHIAAPSLAITPESPIENIILNRLSTVYFPQGKITMLPEAWINAFSLNEGTYRPAFSIYFDIDANMNLSKPTSSIDSIYIEKNLRIHEIEPYFNSDNGIGNINQPQFAFHQEMIYLHNLAIHLQKQRNRYEENAPKKYDYHIGFDDNDKVRIITRERGSPIDTVVSEMMILANSHWAQSLNEHNLGGLFRTQPATGRVRMSIKSETHHGMNLAHYGWFTSPLRRATDYINQKQLQSLLQESTPARYSNNDSMLFAALNQFETAYNAYRDFQNQMEAYWSLVYLQQQNIHEIQAYVLKDDLVRLEGLPLSARAIGIPPDINAKTQIKLAISDIDTEKQFIGLRYLNIVVPNIN